MTLDTTTVAQSSIEPAKALLHSTAPSRHRFHLLDGLRGIAAFLVVLHHMPHFMCNIGQENAFLSVDFFFCLSGFVIGFSYEKRLSTIMSLKDFFAARAIRLYPTYLLGTLLSLYVFLTNLHYPLTTLVKTRLLALILCQVGMLPNLHIWPGHALFPLDGPGWSLFYELLANIAFAALIRKKLSGRWAMVLSTLPALAFLSLWAIRGHSLDAGWANDWHHVSIGIARVTLSFSMGILMLRLFQRSKRPVLNPMLQRAIPFALITAFILILTTPIPAAQLPGFQVLTIFLLLPVIVYLGSLTTPSPSWTKLCVFLGNISYPVYLLQAFLFDLLYKPHMMLFAMRHPYAVLASFLLLLTTVAHFAFTLYDSPVRSRLTKYYNASVQHLAPSVS